MKGMESGAGTDETADLIQAQRVCGGKRMHSAMRQQLRLLSGSDGVMLSTKVDLLPVCELLALPAFIASEAIYLLRKDFLIGRNPHAAQRAVASTIPNHSKVSFLSRPCNF